MTLSPFPGFFGHQAVNTVDERRNRHPAIKKAASEEAAQMVLMQLIYFVFL